MVLETAGYSVLSAATPRNALEVYSGRSIDLILTDVVMPDMSGPTFVKEWEKTNPQTQILYMSGYIDESVGHHSISGGDVISKPFSPAELVESVSRSLGTE